MGLGQYLVTAYLQPSSLGETALGSAASGLPRASFPKCVGLRSSTRAIVIIMQILARQPVAALQRPLVGFELPVAL